MLFRSSATHNRGAIFAKHVQHDNIIANWRETINGKLYVRPCFLSYLRKTHQSSLAQSASGRDKPRASGEQIAPTGKTRHTAAQAIRRSARIGWQQVPSCNSGCREFRKGLALSRVANARTMRGCNRRRRGTIWRAEERRGGKESERQCRSRW